MAEYRAKKPTPLRNVQSAEERRDAAPPKGYRLWTDANGNGGRTSKPVLGEDALHGLIGEYLTLVEPFSEAVAPAIGSHLLTYLGICIGRKAYFRVQGEKHWTNGFTAIVGPTSLGTKGTADAVALVLLRVADPDFFGAGSSRIRGTIGSGQRLVHSVRDPIRGADKDGNSVVKDNGEPDKRLVIVNAEWSVTLKATQGEGAILGEILRQAFDGLPLSYESMKQGSLSCAEPHVGMIGHITPEELRETLSNVNLVNGFGNRIEWMWSETSLDRLRDDDDDDIEEAIDGEALSDLVERLTKTLTAIESLPHAVRYDLSPQARALWKKHYRSLRTGEGDGLVKVLTARGAPIVRRKAMLLAALDLSFDIHSHNDDLDTLTPPPPTYRGVIEVEHLRAALAWWRYSVDTVRYVFGEHATYDTESLLLHEIRERTAAGAWMTHTDQQRLFGNNRGAQVVQARASLLARQAIADFTLPGQGGRNPMASVAITRSRTVRR